jgi:hypothetical protein
VYAEILIKIQIKSIGGISFYEPGFRLCMGKCFGTNYHDKSF